jgi:hypothetical protein
MSIMNAWFYPHAALGSYLSLPVSLLLMTVILIRTNAVLKGGGSQQLFRYYSYAVSLVILAGAIAACFYIDRCFSWGYAYDKHPDYNIYLLTHGLMVNTILSIHMVVSAFAFLYTIYSSRGSTVNEFVYDWILKQNGVRYCSMLLLNVFNIVCFFYAMARGQNEVFRAHVGNRANLLHWTSDFFYLSLRVS